MFRAIFLKVSHYFFFFQNALQHSKVEVLSYKSLKFQVGEMKGSKVMQLKRQRHEIARALRAALQQ